MKKVYTIEEGSCHEGGGVSFVCSTLEIARCKVKEILTSELKKYISDNKYKLEFAFERLQESNEINKSLAKYYRPSKFFKEISKNYWSNKYDYIKIKEMNLL